MERAGGKLIVLLRRTEKEQPVAPSQQREVVQPVVAIAEGAEEDDPPLCPRIRFDAEEPRRGEIDRFRKLPSEQRKTAGEVAGIVTNPGVVAGVEIDGRLFRTVEPDRVDPVLAAEQRGQRFGRFAGVEPPAGEDVQIERGPFDVVHSHVGERERQCVNQVADLAGVAEDRFAHGCTLPGFLTSPKSSSE